MAWEHLSITKPHLVYIILGGFTSLFMLCSSIIKERLYIGEATVATLCGIIFGPHAANLINPMSWGNEDLITLEFSRIVLVVQCFAVGVELPKAYMERHWRSVTFLLVPVMTFGWLITSLFIWWMVPTLNWLDSLCCAACVTATDPVLASSVVGKGKFAKRVPKHLRDLLSAESGCNDGMAFPFIYLALYLIRYRPDADKVAFHWFCYTILYECIFGAFYGVLIGYIARRAIRYAHEKDLIDRESFLVFYFVLALFCAGSGSLLGMDDLLVGFACGVGFSNDGWFTEKTEEAHVSNVIDLLINLAFFVYFGTIIPWEQFNAFDTIGLAPWRLVVIAVMVIFFRRIPVMMMLKPVIPDLKTWREALFAGHFGPIGVGAIFVAILARAELETEETTPLGKLPEPGFEHLNIIEVIWPLTCFLVIASIVVHGSSIAVFTLGKHINTLTLTLSYTQGIEEATWMDRLPRIQSRSKSSMSLSRRPSDANSEDEKSPFPPGTLGPVGFPGNFLRRQKEEEGGSRASSIRPSARRKKWDQGLGPGGPVSQSAIAPRRQEEPGTPLEKSGSETLAMDEDSGASSPDKNQGLGEPQEEVYIEGHNVVIEDRDGNVLEVKPLHEIEGQSEQEKRENILKEGRKLMREKDVEHGVAQTEEITEGHAPITPGPEREGDNARVVEGPKAAQEATEVAEKHGMKWRDMRHRMQSFGGVTRRHEATADQAPKPEQRRGPALAYQFGNTIIVEDEDGEVIKKYDIPGTRRPAGERRPSLAGGSAMQRLRGMGSYLGRSQHHHHVAEGSTAGPSTESPSDPNRGNAEEADDERIRFTVGSGGRRLSKAEFINQVRQLDPKARVEAVNNAQAPESVKRQVKRASAVPEDVDEAPEVRIHPPEPSHQPKPTNESAEEVPMHDVQSSLARFSLGGNGQETAAQRRRRQAASSPQGASSREESASPGRVAAPRQTQSKSTTAKAHHSKLDEGETAAERRRREGALGMTKDDSESEEEDEGAPGTRKLPAERGRIRFADQPATSAASGAPAQEASSPDGLSGSQSFGRLRWGDDVRSGKK